MSFLARLDVERSDRITVDRPATVRDLRKAPSDVIVDNLSTTGCLVTLDFALPLGALISIGIAGIGPCFARVGRCDHPRYGCAFLVPITEAEIEASRVAETIVKGRFPALPAAAIAPAAIVIPEPDAPAAGELSARMKVAVIVGSAVLCWASLAAASLLSLR
jgi:hypothetical protein